MSAPFHVDNTYVFYYNHLCLVQVKGVIEAVENACLPLHFSFLFAIKFYTNRRYNMKLSIFCLWLFFLSIGVIGCAFDPPPYTKGKDEELDSLINAYKSHTAKMKEELESRRLTRIKQLSVEKVLDGDGNAQDSGKETQNGYVVSVSLDKAPVDEVIHQILEEAKLPYFVDAAALNGYVSARFDKQPLIDALNVILAPSLLSAKLQNGIVVVSSSLTDESIPSTAIVQEAVTLKTWTWIPSPNW